ncbi:MAG: hypothetical protein IJ088_02815 [Clostridia bacterium]|nr:hypothetical protein [Clostridia bacterium]
MHDNQGALHVTVRHSMTGRIRLSFEKPFPNPEVLRMEPGVLRMEWNPRICSMLLLYDPSFLTEFDLLRQVCGQYAAQVETALIHVRHEEEEGYTLSSSGLMALVAIGADGLANAFALPVTSVTKWLSVISTLAAVVDHGWEELNQKGSFDPEVMSIVYLLNSVSKGNNTLQASAIAWILTFGRHLIPKDPRETEWMTTRHGNRVTLTPIAIPSSRSYARKLLQSGLDAMTRQRGKGLNILQG